MLYMKLSEYDDETLLEEVKHRGFKIEIVDIKLNDPWFSKWVATQINIRIGGIQFELST